MTKHRKTKTADPTPEQSLDTLIAELERFDTKFKQLRLKSLTLLEQIYPLLIEAANLHLKSGLPADISGLCAELERLCSLEPASPNPAAAETDTVPDHVPDQIERMLSIMRELRKLMPRFRSLLADAREISRNLQRYDSGRQPDAPQIIAGLINKRIDELREASKGLLEEADRRLEEARQLNLERSSPIPGELSDLCNELRALLAFNLGTAAAAALPEHFPIKEFTDRIIATATRIQELGDKLSALTTAERNKQAPQMTAP